MTTDPAGSPVPNGAITVTVVLPCSNVGLYDQLEFSTGLVEPAWDARRVVQGNESPIVSAYTNGKTLTVPGAVFNLNRGVSGSVRIVLKGYVPENPAGGDLLRIRQLDADGIEYAYPSGYVLPMSGTAVEATTTAPVTTTGITRPVTTDSSFGDLIEAEPTAPSFGELISARPTERSFGDIAGATPGTSAPTRKGSLAVPTPWTTVPQPTETPLDPVVVLAAAGVILCVMRR